MCMCIRMRARARVCTCLRLDYRELQWVLRGEENQNGSTRIFGTRAIYAPHLRRCACLSRLQNGIPVGTKAAVVDPPLAVLIANSAAISVHSVRRTVRSLVKQHRSFFIIFLIPYFPSARSLIPRFQILSHSRNYGWLLCGFFIQCLFAKFEIFAR